VSSNWENSVDDSKEQARPNRTLGMKVGWKEIRVYPCGENCWAAASTKTYEDGTTDHARFARHTKDQALDALKRYIQDMP
jgi:hypothetical protein